MQCPVCKTPNRPEAKYCRRCGATLTTPATTAAVAQTQRTFRPARQICAYCGASLRADARSGLDVMHEQGIGLARRIDAEAGAAADGEVLAGAGFQVGGDLFGHGPG